jgi:hypothetical protein
MATDLATLHGMTKDELVSGLARAKAALINVRDKLEAPMTQGASTLAGWGGGVASGLIRAFIPEVFGLPVDGVLGVLTSGLCLLKAGDSLVDATAVFGVGLAAPAFSRGTEAIVKNWMAQPKA